MFRVLDDSIDQSAFNDVAIHPLQSWEWGEVKQQLGNEVVRFGEYEGETLVRVYQMSLHPIPRTGKRVGYIPRGEFPSRDVLDFFVSYGKKHNITHITFEPNVLKEDMTDDLDSYHPRFQNAVQVLFTPWQFLLDLTKPEDDLLAGMKSKTRYNIRLAAKKGITVEVDATQKGFDQFVDLYKQTAKRQKYFGRTPAYLQTMWDKLGGKMAHVIIARYEGEPLVAYILFHFHNTLYYPYGGSSTAHRNRMPANLLMWEAIKFGKSRGATLFDMWGALAPGYPKDHPWTGFTRFKEGYGGRHVEFVGSFDLVISPLWHRIFAVLYKLRQKKLKRPNHEVD